MSTIHNLNNLELKAMRQSLGLTVTEASELKDIEVSKRFFQYLESGERTINQDINNVFYNLATQYDLALYCLTRDIDEYKQKNYPATKNKTLALPLFHSFELWKEKTGNQYQYFWKIYQAIIGHLLLIGKLTALDDDDIEIPEYFSIWNWIHLKYEVTE